MLNIVVPMAGRGSRFSEAGYRDPKPLIEVMNKAMIEVVINNLTPKVPHKFIFICQNAHILEYELRAKLNSYTAGCEIIGIDGVTDGAACTVLKAKQYIDNDVPLMIANSDQYVDIDINDYLKLMDNEYLNGIIMTMSANDEKWSYAKINEEKFVVEVKEKQVISEHATVGIYNFSSGKDFVRGANAMIADKEMQNGEYYVAPVYNRLVSEGQKIGIYNVGSEANGMYGLGTPTDLELFLTLPISRKI